LEPKREKKSAQKGAPNHKKEGKTLKEGTPKGRGDQKRPNSPKNFFAGTHPKEREGKCLPKPLVKKGSRPSLSLPKASNLRWGNRCRSYDVEQPVS